MAEPEQLEIVSHKMDRKEYSQLMAFICRDIRQNQVHYDADSMKISILNLKKLLWSM